MELEKLIEKLKDRNLMLVANQIGIHSNTLYKIVNGISKPTYKTYIKLVKYLES